MHGDDVASAGVEVTTQIVSKATELFMEMLKIAIEREREKNQLSEQQEVLSGGEVTYQKLKEGGEVTMLPSFAKEDYGEFLKQAKKMDIPVAAIREQGKDNTLSVFFNEKDKEAVNSIVQGIVREKMKAPEQTERMITIEKEQVEGFQNYCAEQDIPVNFFESQNGVNCIFSRAYEKQIEAALENFRKINRELSDTSIGIQKSENGKLKILFGEKESGKALSMNFCTKAKLERVLRERMGYSKTKAIVAANALQQRLSEEQKKYYLSGSRQLEQMECYQKDIKFENENVLTDGFSFAKLKFPDEDFSRLTITDNNGNFVVLSEKNIDREQAEKSIRAHLKISENEVISAILAKAERLGFAEKPKITQFKEYRIERETQSAFTVRGGNTVELYIKGNLNVFAHKTNVNTTNRVVCYDIKDLGKQLKTLGMLIVLDYVWNRITENRAKGKRTWIYMDEVYLLFANEYSANFLFELYKRARKWGGVPTGITQNVEDLLKSETARSMLSNTDFVMMLNQATSDRVQLARLLNISDNLLAYVTNSDSGQGLICCGGSVIPFRDKFPHNELYDLMTTKLSEMKIPADEVKNE